VRVEKKGRKVQAGSLRPNGRQERRSTIPLLVSCAVLHDFPTSRRIGNTYWKPSFPGKAILCLRQLVARSKASSNSKLEKIEEANLELHRDEMYKGDVIEFTNISRRSFSRSIF